MSAHGAWLRRFLGAYAWCLSALRAWRLRLLVAGAWIVAAHWAERVAVPLGILEVLCRSHKVVDGEVVFVVEESGATAYNLLEFHHRVYRSE